MVGDGLRPRAEPAERGEGEDLRWAISTLLRIPCYTCPELEKCVPDKAATCGKLSAVIDGDP